MSTLATNKRARHDYIVTDEIEAGIKLTGAEVKSAKLGRFNLSGSYAAIRDNALWLIGAHISPYVKAKGSQQSYDPDRSRKLLLRASELRSLIGTIGSGGLTIVPLSAYTSGGFVKVKIGVARGKRKADRRESVKKRDAERRARQATYRRR